MQCCCARAQSLLHCSSLSASDVFNSTLERLYHFQGDNAGLVGPLPAEWSTLNGLEDIDLGLNRLTSTLPGQWSALSSLRALDLSGNQLEGGIPLVRLPTQLTGHLPSITVLLGGSAFMGATATPVGAPAVRWIYSGCNGRESVVVVMNEGLPVDLAEIAMLVAVD